MMRLPLIFILLIFAPATFAQTSPQIRATSKARINGMSYKAICFADERIVVKNGSGKTVLSIAAQDYIAFFDFSFTDFDGDGYKDLLIVYSSNTPGICNLYSYQKASGQFIKIDGFDIYPAPLRIHGTKVFYSYHHSGCADSNWDSDLFIIKNYKPVKLGNISGNEFGNSGIKDGIYIHKFKSGKELLYKTMPISTINRYKDYKWGFIATYWKKYYKEFAKGY